MIDLELQSKPYNDRNSFIVLLILRLQQFNYIGLALETGILLGHAIHHQVPSLTLPIAFLWTLLPATCLTHYLGSKAIHNKGDNRGSKNDFLRISAALFTLFVLQIAAEI